MRPISGLAYLNLGAYADARACFAKVVKLDPGSDRGRQAKKMLDDIANRTGKRP